MRLRSNALPLLLLLFVFQSPQGNIRRHYDAAEAARRAGNFDAAEREYAAILAEGYAQLGRIYSAENRYSEAVETLEAAARYAPDSVATLVDLAIAYFDSGQYRKALEPLARAVALDPRSVGAHHMLGKTYFMLGDFPKAVAELETARGLAPKDYDIAYTLGLAHLKQHEFAPAKEIYERMLAQLGDRPQLHIVFGRAYRETAFLPEAIEEFRRAVALDPHFPRAHYYLGLTYLLKDGAARLDDAAAEFKVELDSNPEEFFANYYLGVVYVIQRKFDSAVGLLEKATRIEPNNPDPYFHLGQAYQSLDRHKDAIRVLRKSIALNPELSHNDYQVTTAHYRLGQSLIKDGQKEEGERELQTAAELKSKSLSRDKERAVAYLSATDLHEQNGKFPEIVSTEGVVAETSAADAKTAQDLKSGEDYYARVLASAHNDTGLLRADRQDFRGAAEQFRLAAKLNPRLEGVDFNWGLAAYKAEAYRDAVPPLERVLAANPSNAQAKQLLGMSYFMAES
jgi:tetratricopeptide (TPR) repeat protein